MYWNKTETQHEMKMKQKRFMVSTVHMRLYMDITVLWMGYQEFTVYIILLNGYYGVGDWILGIYGLYNTFKWLNGYYGVGDWILGIYGSCNTFKWILRCWGLDITIHVRL